MGEYFGELKNLNYFDWHNLWTSLLIATHLVERNLKVNSKFDLIKSTNFPQKISYIIISSEFHHKQQKSHKQSRKCSKMWRRIKK